MNRTTIALSIFFVALAASATYFQLENRSMRTEIAELTDAVAELRTDNNRLSERIEAVRSSVDDARETTAAAQACDTRFPPGMYRLLTNTSYGPNIAGEYSIHHASIALSEWSVNAGMRLNSFGVPTDFYFDYNGDGRIDTAMAARLVREIPIAGNSLADRMLADSRVHQGLYSVFSCEWRNAEYTSPDDMNSRAAGTSTMLWDLVQGQSENILEWIQSE